MKATPWPVAGRAFGPASASVAVPSVVTCCCRFWRAFWTWNSGRTIPEALRDVRVDVVVLDKEMPGTGGLQALAQLRRSHPRLPVILITAFGGPDVERRALALGATRYLEKPFPLRHLIESVRQASRVSALPLGGPDTG